VTPAAAEPTPALSPIATTTRPTIINGGAPTAGTQVAAVDQRATLSDASPAPAGSAGTEVASAATSTAQMPPMSFRWPAKGRVLSNFGPRPDGTHNDGVDIAVPLGAEVVAAESGVVIYAGNELRGFGSLLLLRHEGGYSDHAADPGGNAGVVRGRVDIDAPPGVVWAVIRDCRLARRMAPAVQSCRIVEQGPGQAWDVREMVVHPPLVPAFRSVFRSDYEPLKIIRFRCTDG
jgi:hypothetical protein